MDNKDLIDAMKLTHVPRWSIIDTIKPQSVAEHTYGVQVIALYLVKQLGFSDYRECMNPIAIGTLLSMILKHDRSEAETGDIPSSHKDTTGKRIENLKNEIEIIIKLADTVEAYIFISRYGVRPVRIIRYLRAKINKYIEMLQKGCSQGVDVQVVVDMIISTGDYYD